MKKFLLILFRILQWGVVIFLIQTSLNHLIGSSAPSSFKTVDDMDWYIIKWFSVGGSVFAWLLFCAYLFPDWSCKEDSLSRWLDTKIGREWRRAS